MARRRAGERFVKDAPYDVRDKDAEIRAATSYVPRKSSRNGAVIFNIATFIATCAAVLGIAFPNAEAVGLLGTLFVSALKAVAPVLVFFLVTSALANAKAAGSMRTVVVLYLVSTFAAALVAHVRHVL